MALLNNIVVDLGAATATLTITKSSNVVETISLGSNQITFAGRPDIVLTGVEFLGLVAQINIFQTALFTIFPAIMSDVSGHLACTCTEAHDVPNNLWNLVCIYGATPRVVNYSAVGSNSTVELLNRANSKTIEIGEWSYFLYQLNHYSNSVKNFLNL